MPAEMPPAEMPQAALAQAALAQLAEGVIVADAAGRITFVNAAAARLHGVARLDVAPDAYAETYHLLTEGGDPYPSDALPLARAVLRGETVTDARWRVRRPDGTEVLAVGSARPVLGPDGARLGAVLTVRDETARAEAVAEVEAANTLLQEQAAELEAQAEELQATAAHLEEQTEAADRARRAAEAERARATGVLEATADAYFALDAAFRIVEVNAAMERGTGLARDQLLGRDFWQTFPGALGTAFERHYRAAAAERVEAHFTHDYSDGRLDLVVDVDAYPAPGGGVVVFWRDVTARVRVEAALRESEARYRLAADAARLGTWTWDLRTDAATFDARVRDLFGFEHDDPWPRAAILATRVHPDDRARVAAALAAAVAPAGDGRYEAEYRVVRPDGTERWALAAGQVQFAGEGAARAPTVLFGTVLDVTERQQAEAARRAALAEAEAARAVASALVESVRDAFVAYDADFRFTYVNAAAEALFAATGAGASPVGRVLWEAYPHLVGTPVEAAMRRAMAERVPVHFDTHDPALRRWYAARVYPAAGGGLTAVWADVTAERRAQQGADFLAQASRTLAASLDYETTLAAVARAAVPYLGDWCAVDIVEDPAAGRWPPTVERLAVVHEDPAMLALGAELTARYPTDWSAEGGMAAVLRDGVPFVVPEVTDAMVVAGARDAEHLRLLRALRFSSILVVPLVARGRTLGALTLCMTESGRRYDEADRALALEVAERAALAVDNARLYREAERARAQAEQARAEAEEERERATAARAAAEAASRAKGEFLATMSHELRTPLNAIGGYAQLLDMGLHGPVTDEQRGALARVQAAQQHLLGLINDVLNYAKLEAGRVEYDLRPVDLGEVTREVAPLVEPLMAARGLQCVIHPPAEPCVVWADRDKLRQVLLNLLSNAAKFTEPGGRVTVEVAVPTAAGMAGGEPVGGAVEGAAGAPGGGSLAFLRVTDTGRGIPPDKQEAIFEPFVQVRGAHASAYAQPTDGTGLGLAISRDLARGMGGDLRVRSTPGEGSTFTVVLRRVVDAAGSPTDRRALDERREEERRAGDDRREADA
jgi:PAS domain S-box-containing protein